MPLVRRQSAGTATIDDHNRPKRRKVLAALSNAPCVKALTPGLGPYAVPLRTSATPASAGFRRSRAVSHKTVGLRQERQERYVGRQCESNAVCLQPSSGLLAGEFYELHAGVREIPSHTPRTPHKHM
jgi:hypothetical protein